jgi:hypothetical protein
MTFGVMTQKWLILKKPLRTKLRMTGKVFLCITRLHNFCINEGDIDCHDGVQADAEGEYFHSDITVQDVRGQSIMRERVVNGIFNLGLQRPPHNRLRNT